MNSNFPSPKFLIMREIREFPKGIAVVGFNMLVLLWYGLAVYLNWDFHLVPYGFPELNLYGAAGLCLIARTAVGYQMEFEDTPEGRKQRMWRSLQIPLAAIVIGAMLKLIVVVHEMIAGPL